MGFLTKLFRGVGDPKPKILVERRDWVMVFESPLDPAWQRRDEERDGDGWHLQELKYVRVEGDERLFLLAKDYSGPDTAREALAEYRARDWKANYAKVFDVTGVRVADGQQMLMDRVVPALDVVVDGTSPTGAQRIRERYAFVPNHKLIITAAGTASAHEKWAADVETWFSTIAFRPG